MVIVHDVADGFSCAPLTINFDGAVPRFAVPPQLFTTLEYVPDANTGRTSVNPSAPHVPGVGVLVSMKVSVLM